MSSLVRGKIIDLNMNGIISLIIYIKVFLLLELSGRHSAHLVVNLKMLAQLIWEKSLHKQLLPNQKLIQN